MDAENVIDLYVEELSRDYLFQLEEHLKKLQSETPENTIKDINLNKYFLSKYQSHHLYKCVC